MRHETGDSTALAGLRRFFSACCRLVPRIAGRCCRSPDRCVGHWGVVSVTGALCRSPGRCVGHRIVVSVTGALCRSASCSVI